MNRFWFCPFLTRLAAFLPFTSPCCRRDVPAVPARGCSVGCSACCPPCSWARRWAICSQCCPLHFAACQRRQSLVWEPQERAAVPEVGWLLLARSGDGLCGSDALVWDLAVTLCWGKPYTAPWWVPTACQRFFHESVVRSV